MRRTLLALLAASAFLAGGCGGGDSESALEVALSYLPRDSFAVAALDTDVEGEQYDALNELLGRFAFGGEARERLQQQLEEATNGRFAEDVRPLLGNPVVAGVAAPEGAPDPLVVWQATDEDKLGEVVERSRAREVGESAGATVYEAGNTIFAVEGDVVVAATGRDRLTAALERADGDDHFEADSFEAAFEGLPEESLVRLYVDLQAALTNSAETADARRIEWVRALRGMALTARARDRSLEVEFRATTDGELSEEDLPIAPGDESPGVIERDGEVGLGIRDLAHIVRFAERAGQAIDPAGFGDYEQAKQTIDSQLGVNLDEDLVGQLTGDVSASVALDGGFGVRAELEDPREFERTLERVSDVLPSFARGAGFGEVELTRLDGRGTVYALASRETGGMVVFGVVNDVLVVGDTARRVFELAEEEPAAVEGARGSAVLGADSEQLANALIEQFGPALGIPDLGGLGTRLVTGPLGDLNGSLSASPDGLRGKLTLAVD